MLIQRVNVHQDAKQPRCSCGRLKMQAASISHGILQGHFRKHKKTKREIKKRRECSRIKGLMCREC